MTEDSAVWETLSVVKRREALWSGSFFFDPPIVDDDAIFCGNKDSQCVRLDRRTLRDVWRVSSEGYYLQASIGRHLLMSDWRRRSIAALEKESGETSWTLERSKWWGAIPWQDVLLLFSDAVEVVDPATGRVLHQIDLPGGPIAYNVDLCGDTLLVRSPEGVDPVRAYDLRSRELLWSRPLVAEAESRFGVRYHVPLITFSPASTPDRLIVSRSVAVLGLRVSDGELLWAAPVGFEYTHTRSASGRVHILQFGRSYLIDEASGATVACHDYDEILERRVWRVWPGVVHEDKVAYTMESSLVVVFRVSTGELVSWCRYKYGLGRPALAFPYLAATGLDGWLVLFGDSTEGRGRRTRG